VRLDDSFELRVFVPRNDEEAPRLLPHARVHVRPGCDVLDAVGVRALAQEDGLGRGRGSVAFLQARDVLVHLAEERLVAGCPLLPERRHDDRGQR
jgi:hypothetical protein